MRRLIALVLGGALLLTSATAVSAAEEVHVDPLACAWFTGGTWTVPADSDIVLTNGWFAESRGQVIAFMKAVTWVLVVDGTEVDLTSYMGEPTQFDRKFWAVRWEYPAGTLDAGETMTITMDSVLSRPVWDGFDHYPRGSTIGGPAECVVTAEAEPV